MGGPVERERGFVLHTDDYRAEHSVGVGGGLALTATRDVLEAMASGEGHPRRAILALGYAGWGAGQLENEIKENVWLTCEADETLIFGGDHELKWSRALAKLGVNAERLSSVAGRA
jgi:putative transcriptional regulator